MSAGRRRASAGSKASGNPSLVLREAQVGGSRRLNHGPRHRSWSLAPGNAASSGRTLAQVTGAAEHGHTLASLWPSMPQKCPRERQRLEWRGHDPGQATAQQLEGVGGVPRAWTVRSPPTPHSPAGMPAFRVQNWRKQTCGVKPTRKVVVVCPRRPRPRPQPQPWPRESNTGQKRMQTPGQRSCGGTAEAAGEPGAGETGAGGEGTGHSGSRA